MALSLLLTSCCQVKTLSFENPMKIFASGTRQLTCYQLVHIGMLQHKLLHWLRASVTCKQCV